MSDVSVRRVGPDDWKTWRDVRLAALADSPEVFPGELAYAQDFDETAWRERLDESYGVWLLATSDTAEPIGQMGAWLPFGSVPTLVQTWVHPVWRGRGVGDALIEEALGWMRERGHDRLDLWVLESNLPAQRLYQRHGFVRTAEYMPCPDLPRIREERMVRRLTRS